MATALSASDLSAANQRPTIQIEDYVYEGELLSAPAWFDWNERIQQLKERIETGKANHRDLMAFYHSFFRALFPKGWRRRGVPLWAPDVANTLMKEPLTTIEEAFERFFVRQARANGVEVPTATRPPMMHGTDSSNRTAGPLGPDED